MSGSNKFSGFAVLLVTVLALLSPLAASPLKFEETLLRVTSLPGDDTVAAVFVYQNTSDKVAEIVEFESSCDHCLSAGPKKKVKPGEKAAIEALFKVGAYTGSVTKTLKVVVVDEAGQRHEEKLTLVVEVPLLIDISPNHLAWKVGGELERKTVEVNMLWKNPMKITGASCTRSNYRIEVETVEEGRHYRVHVTPTGLSTAQMGLVKISTDCEFKKFRDHVLFLSVLKADDISAGADSHSVENP